MKIEDMKVSDISEETLTNYLKGMGYKVEKLGKPELLCGYTREQWGFMMENNILCGYSDISSKEAQKRAGDIEKLRPLVRIDEDDDFVYSDIDGDYSGFYTFCAPTTAQMTWRPHFGGECPVDKNEIIAVKFRDGNFEMYSAGVFSGWEHTGDYPGNEIILFMELK